MNSSRFAYVVFHVRETDSGHEDVKIIGVYSSQTNADSAIARISKLPGFVDCKEGFTTDEYPVDEDHWTEGFSNL